MDTVNSFGLEVNGQRKSTRDREVRGAACWGQLRHARCAYDVVSFLPTQTSSTRLVVMQKQKSPERFRRGLGVEWREVEAGLAVGCSVAFGSVPQEECNANEDGKDDSSLE